MKTFLFHTKSKNTGRTINIEVEAIDTRAAIAYLEMSYPHLEWTITDKPNHS